MNDPRQEVGVAAIGTRIYVVGGYREGGVTAATVEVFDTVAGTWSFAAPMPVAVNHPAAAAVAGRLYVFGGDASGSVSGATIEYDPERDSWALEAPMPTPRAAPMAAVVDGTVYVAGGTPGGHELEAYDVARDSWTRKASMPTARNHVAGAAIGRLLYAVGGRPPTTLAALEAYDPAADRWAARAPMPTGRSGHAAAVVRGCLYVLGGEGNPRRPDGVFPEVEVYDPRSDSWSSVAPMPTPRHGIGAAVVGDTIYVPGGANVQGLGVTPVFEAYTVPGSKTCEG